MKKLILILFVLLVRITGFAQVQQSLMFEKTWGNPYLNYIQYADEQPNGDFILIGRCGLRLFGNFPSPAQVYMCRIDSAGNLLWEKTYGDTTLYNFISSLTKTANGTYLIVGTREDISDNPYVINLDANGNVLFDTNYFDSLYDNGVGSYICESDDTCFTIASYYATHAQGLTSPTLIKIDKNGNQIWMNTLNTFIGYYPRFIQETPDGGYISLGQWNGPNGSIIYVLKYDANGNELWVKFPLSDSLSFQSNGVFMKPDGSVYFFYTDANQSTYRLDLDTAGDQISNQLIIQNFPLNFRSNPFTPSGNIATYNLPDSSLVSTCMEYSYGGEWITELSNTGNVSFKAKLCGVDSLHKYLNYSIKTSDGGYLSVGENDDPAGIEYSRFYVVKFGPDGRYQPDDFLSSITIYPVPSPDGNITATFDSQKDATLNVRVLSSDGKLVYQGSLFVPANSQTELPIRLDEQTARSGMYILEARTSDAIYRKKLVIARER